MQPANSTARLSSTVIVTSQNLKFKNSFSIELFESIFIFMKSNFFIYNPGTKQGRKWENAMTIDKYSWGNRRNARLSDFMTTKVLFKT